MEKIGIYIHIPFCKRTCFYCHFCKQEYEPELVEKYIDTLVKEIHLRSTPAYLVDSIYIGGGSPSLLKEHQVSAIINGVSGHFKIDRTVEFTFEMNPEDVSAKKMQFLKEMGINRLSLGTQSFVREDLAYLKRTHNVRQSLEAIECALETGFSNINVDFIIGLPTQSKKTLKENLSVLKNFDIPHISAYLLESPSPGDYPGGSYSHSPVSSAKKAAPGNSQNHAKRISDSFLRQVEESDEKDVRDIDLYFFTRDFLSRLGYSHYEVSNFSKEGFQSRHNLKYWENRSYIGAGLSASGYEKGLDYKNTVDFSEYFTAIDGHELPQAEVKRLNPALRRIVMGLRLLKGISLTHFKNYREQLDLLVSEGFLNVSGNEIAVNPQKILLLNEILTYFLTC